MDETRQKIIDATMSLIRDKGYVSTTTKDIVLHGVSQKKQRAHVTPELYEETAPMIMKVPRYCAGGRQ